ncbi:hypothetical protein LCGC14_0799500 [marine sediment metagenome]|uniref:Uncharacterized protein n=1 Tax=marine sediment metagenome TaxID=412755 RepID=A0A0F9PQ35_9ZZZZ
MLERNERLHNRLYNEKYGSAMRYLTGEDEEVKELVGALAQVLGNIGWWHNREDIEEWINWDEVDPDQLQIILNHALADIGFFIPKDKEANNNA